MVMYPTWAAKEISEVWHADHWQEFDYHLLNPAWRSNMTGEQFYVDKIARLIGNKYVMPYMWLNRLAQDGVEEVCALCYPVKYQVILVQ